MFFRTFGNNNNLALAAPADPHEAGGACCSECAAAARASGGMGFVSTGETLDGPDWSWLWLIAAGVMSARVFDWFLSPKPAPQRARRKRRRRSN